MWVLLDWMWTFSNNITFSASSISSVSFIFCWWIHWFRKQHKHTSLIRHKQHAKAISNIHSKKAPIKYIRYITNDSSRTFERSIGHIMKHTVRRTIPEIIVKPKTNSLNISLQSFLLFIAAEVYNRFIYHKINVLVTQHFL